MPPYGEPDWASPGDTTNNAITTPTETPGMTPTPITSSAVTSHDSSGAGGGGTLCTILSILNFILFGMMSALGVLELIDYDSSEGGSVSWNNVASSAFISAYMILLALLLFVYELMWWIPIGPINVALRRNFGFMYGLRGKGLYLIFVAFLTIGILDSEHQSLVILAWTTGISFLVVGTLHIFYTIANPDIMDRYKPPSAGLDRLNRNRENVV